MTFFATPSYVPKSASVYYYRVGAREESLADIATKFFGSAAAAAKTSSAQLEPGTIVEVNLKKSTATPLVG